MPPDLKSCPSGGPVPWCISELEHQQPLLNGRMQVADGPERASGGANSESPLRDPLAGHNLEAIVTDPVCQRLFRLFLVFAGENLVRSPEGRLLRCITRAQAQFLLGQIGLLRDQMQIAHERLLPSVHSEEDAQLLSNSDQLHWQNDGIQFSADQVTFRELLGQALALCPRRLHFAPLVDRLFARYVLQIVRKGFLLCRPVRLLPRALRPFSCCLLPGQATPSERMAALQRGGIFRPSAGRWRPFWCVLMPGQLHCWPLASRRISAQRQLERVEEEQLEVGQLEGKRNAKWTVRLARDSLIELSDLERGGQLFGWVLATRTTLLEFAHFDQLQRQLWIADLEMVVRKRRPSLLLHFDRLNSCRMPTMGQKETMRRSPSVGKQLLERENRALLEALEAERRALKDEETVRHLATRMLDEEVQRGDCLRQAVEQLNSELEAERMHRIQLENRLCYHQYNGHQETPAIAIEDASGKVTDDVEREGNGLSFVAPQRLVTPMPRAKKGKRLRDSLRNKRKQRQEGGGEELAIVNVDPRQWQNGAKEDEEHQKGEADGDDGLQLPVLPPLPAAFNLYEQGGTLRATDFWDAQKCYAEEQKPPSAVDAALIMAMSTRSV